MKTPLLLSLAAALIVLVGCSRHDDEVNVSHSAPYGRSVVYSCDNGMDFVADFSGEHLTLSIADGPIVNLKQQSAASGLFYSNSSYEFRGKGDSAVLRTRDKHPTNCAAML